MSGRGRQQHSLCLTALRELQSGGSGSICSGAQLTNEVVRVEHVEEYLGQSKYSGHISCHRWYSMPMCQPSLSVY